MVYTVGFRVPRLTGRSHYGVYCVSPGAPEWVVVSKTRLPTAKQRSKWLHSSIKTPYYQPGIMACMIA